MKGKGAIQRCYVMEVVGGGVQFSGGKRYVCVNINVISVTRGWVWVQFPRKEHYVTLEWPLRGHSSVT